MFGVGRDQIRYVFTSSYAKTGFYTFIPELIAQVRQVYILKGHPGAGKSTLIRLLGDLMLEHGYEIEFWVSAIEPHNLDGLYIVSLDIAVINGSLPVPIDPIYPAGQGEIINLGNFLDKSAICEEHEEIQKLALDIRQKEIKTNCLLRNAAIVKDDIKNVTSKYLNLEKVSGLINTLAKEILADLPKEKHFFASALTAEGMINYIDDISEDCLKRYILKGHPGSAKSTIINELASIFKEQGYIIEYYHSGFDVESIEMIIINELRVALIDGGSIDLRTRPLDVVIDMAAVLDNYEVEAESVKKSEIYRSFEALLLEIQTELDSSRSMLNNLKKIYAMAVDFEKLDEERQRLGNEILGL